MLDVVGRFAALQTDPRIVVDVGATQELERDRSMHGHAQVDPSLSAIL
jgi:hypothetical protein